MRIEGLENINTSLSTHYLVYKITNDVNGKYYVGQHQTNNVFDDYYGSGYLLPREYEKYGLENFTKHILYDFDNFDDMNNKEFELVQLSNCWPLDKMSYNLVVGGHRRVLPEAIEQRRIQKCKETWNNKSPEEKKQYSELKRKQSTGKNNSMYGKNFRDFMSAEAIKIMDEKRRKAWKNKTKQQIAEIVAKRKRTIASYSAEEKEKIRKNLSKASCGKNNPMYGSTFIWMIHTQTLKRIRANKDKIDDYLKQGFVLGFNLKRS